LQNLRLAKSKKGFAESAGKDLLPIFFLNLDKSADRRETLWKDYVALSDSLTSDLRVQLQRVSAVSTAEVESMLENNVLHFNEGFTLTHSERRDNAKKSNIPSMRQPVHCPI
jgi:hypothetical protein